MNKELKDKIIEILLQPFPIEGGWRLTEKSACWFADQILGILEEDKKQEAQDKINYQP